MVIQDPSLSQIRLSSQLYRLKSEMSKIKYNDGMHTTIYTMLTVIKYLMLCLLFTWTTGNKYWVWIFHVWINDFLLRLSNSCKVPIGWWKSFHKIKNVSYYAMFKQIIIYVPLPHSNFDEVPCFITSYNPIYNFFSWN